MQLFHIEDLSSDIIDLPKEESQHCVRVLRLSEGDIIFLTDGNGLLCKGEIISTGNKSCSVHIMERTENFQQRDYRLHLAVAPTKNAARMEWFLEKAVEIGIDEFTPIICEHSERNFMKTERLEKIAVSAMKQSLKAYKPIINEPVKIKDFLQKDFEGQKFIAYCEGDTRTPLKSLYEPKSPAVVLIGPEGDFSKSEIETALETGFIPVTLGTSRLRTETAALATCFFINLLNE